MLQSETLSGAAETDQLLGQVLQGKYRVTEQLAKGGMGTVYQATELSSGRIVAIKTINSNQSHLARRFVREARLLSKLKHPNVVNLIEFGTTDAGMMFIVMDFLEGCTLESVVPSDKGLATDVVFVLMAQICAGVGAAHRLNIVHRDLKPANIFLASVADGGPLVKVLDFGIAKLLEDTEGLTQNGALLGSCGYMSPEQIHGAADVDARADIYSLGGILYYLIAGQPAYRGRSTAEVLSKQLTKPPEPIRFEALHKPVPLEVMSVILKAMDADPDRRYQSVNDLLGGLRGVIGSPRASALPALSLPAFKAASVPTDLTPMPQKFRKYVK